MKVHVRLYRSEKDKAVERAARRLAEVTGQEVALWVRVLRWRVRHFKGSLERALTARDTQGTPVYAYAKGQVRR